MMHKAQCSIEEIPYCFSRLSVKFEGHTGQKISPFWPELRVSGLLLPFEFTNGFEHKAWRSIEEVPYCFSRSSIKFEGHAGWRMDDFNPIWVRLLGRSQLSNPSDLHCFSLSHLVNKIDILCVLVLKVALSLLSMVPVIMDEGVAKL